MTFVWLVIKGVGGQGSRGSTSDHFFFFFFTWGVTVEATTLFIIEQEIDVIVKVISSKSSWLFTAMYASPVERHILWDDLNKVAELHNMP